MPTLPATVIVGSTPNQFGGISPVTASGQVLPQSAVNPIPFSPSNIKPSTFTEVGGTHLGGGVGGGNSSSLTPAEQIASQYNQQLSQGKEFTEVGGNKSNIGLSTQQEYQASQGSQGTQQGQIQVLAEGGVRVGTGVNAQTYFGDMIIPQVGITANEFSNQTKKNAVSLGQVKQEDINYYNYTVNLEPAKTTSPSNNTFNLPNENKTYTLPANLVKGQPNFYTGIPDAIAKIIGKGVELYNTPVEFQPLPFLPAVSAKDIQTFAANTYMKVSDFALNIAENKDLNPVVEKITSRLGLKSAAGVTGVTTKLLQNAVNNAPTTYGGLADIGIATAINPVGALTLTGLMSEKNLLEPAVVEVGQKVSDIGNFLTKEPDLKNVGEIVNIGGMALQGSATLIPSTPEGVLGYTILGKALESKYIPKLVKSIGLKTISATSGYAALTEPNYNPETGKGLTPEQRYGEFLVAGLSAVGSLPEDIVLARKVRYKLGGTEKTIVGDIGIQETPIDLGKTDINIKTGEIEKELIPVDVQYIPSQKEVFTKRVDPLKTLNADINFKEPKDIKLVKTNNEGESLLLDIIKRNDGEVTGSYAQEVLIKGARKHGDLDLVAPRGMSLEDFGALIERESKGKFEVKSHPIFDEIYHRSFEGLKVVDKSTGKSLADLQISKNIEQGYGELFEPIVVDGIKLVPPEVRLMAKVLQASVPVERTKFGRLKREKVLTDIAQLIGNPDLETNPALLRGYGLTKEEQFQKFKGKPLYLVHGGQGVIPAFGNEIILKEGEFFVTPSLESEGAFARKSRMGLGQPVDYSSIFDLLNKEEREKIKFYPSAKNVVIEKGKLGEDFDIPNPSTTEIEMRRNVETGKNDRLIIQKRFRTIIEGEPVEIAYAKKSGAFSDTDISNEVKSSEPSKEISSRVNKERVSSKGTIKTSQDESALNDFLNNRENKIKEKTTNRLIEKSKTSTDEVELKDFTKEEETRNQERERNNEKVLRTPQALRILPKVSRVTPRNPNRDIPRDILRDVPRNPNPRTPNPRPKPRTPETDIPREPLRDVPRTPPRVPPREPPRVPPRLPPRIPPTNPKVPPVINLGGLNNEKQVTNEKAYYAYVKEPKTKKLVRITKKPVDLQTAKDDTAYVLKETTSRTGKWKQVKGKPSPTNPLTEVPKGYYPIHKEEFRDFIQRKGKRIPLRNTIIEKSKHLLSTRGAKREITVFKEMAKLEKKRQAQSNKPTWQGIA